MHPDAASSTPDDMQFYDTSLGIDVYAGNGGTDDNTIDLAGIQVSHINRIEGGYSCVELSDKCQSAAVLIR